MNNNYVLIGLIILTVACIYLFYTNFQKNKEYEALVRQLKIIKLENEKHKQYLFSMQRQPNPEQVVDENIPKENENQEHQEHQEHQEKNMLNVDVNIQEQENNSHENEIDITLDEHELEEINNLDELEEMAELGNTNEANLKSNELDDVASVVESVLLEPVNTNNNTNTDENLNRESNDEIEIELELESNTNLDSVSNHTSESNDVSTNQNKDHIDQENNENEQLMNLSSENLDNMTLKELRLACKNLDLKTKGNKDDLINRIKDKLVSSE